MAVLNQTPDAVAVPAVSPQDVVTIHEIFCPGADAVLTNIAFYVCGPYVIVHAIPICRGEVMRGIVIQVECPAAPLQLYYGWRMVPFLHNGEVISEIC